MPQKYVVIVWGKKNKLKTREYLNAEGFKIPEQIEKIYFETYYTTEDRIGLGMKKLFSKGEIEK